MINTFYLLAVLELAWSVTSVLIRNAGMQVFVSTIVTRIMFIGFFAYLLRRGTLTANEITKSFSDLAVATTLTDGEINPSNIMDLGQVLWSRLYQDATDIGLWDIVFTDNVSITTPVVLIFAGMAAFMVMALLSAHFGVVLLESFFAASGGVILLGLGSSRWTYQYAASYLKYAMSVGMKLFILLIVMGLTISEISRFMANAALDDINNVFAMLAFITFSLVVSILVPRSVRGMMEGVSVATANIGAVSDNRRVVSKNTGQVNKLLTPK